MTLEPYDKVLYQATTPAMNGTTLISQTSVNLNGVTNNRLFRLQSSTTDQGASTAANYCSWLVTS